MKKIISMIIISLSSIVAFSASSTSGGNAGCSGPSCTAFSTVGTRVCKACCQVGQVAECIGGYRSCSAKCDGTPQLRSHGVRTPGDIAFDNAFIDYCVNYGTSNMTTLSTKVTTVVNAIDAQNMNAFTNAEIDYFNFFLTLTAQEVSDINNFVKSNGFPGF